MPYFISYAIVYWLDVFIREEYKQIWIDSIKYCQQNKGLEVFGWCLMSSHAHMIIRSEHQALEDIVRDFKKHTSLQIRQAIENNPQESRKEWLLWMLKRAAGKNSNNTAFQFWQQHNHPIELNSNEKFLQKLTYIHNNPVAAGFVKQPQDWIYSSANGYENNTGLLKLHYA